MMNEALRLLRVYHDMNQADVAAHVGISKSYVSEIESGNKKVSMDLLEKYSVAFNVPMSSLMLFAERVDENQFSEDVRMYVAEKTIKMLDWIETISGEHKEESVG